MNEELVLKLSQDAIKTTAMIASPMLVAALLIGLIGIAIRLPAGGMGAAACHRSLAEAYGLAGADRAAEDHRLEAERLEGNLGRRLGQDR